MKIFICTQRRLARAKARVTRELARHGVWNERLEDIDVRLVWLHPYSLDAYGWQQYGGSGSIEIPAVSLPRITHRLGWSRYLPLIDVLRHEYAHAIADTHRGLIRSRRFSGAFGGSHDCGFESEYHAEEHTDPYAATSPCEDFAEIVTVFLKHRGCLPKRFKTPAISSKWRFIRQLFTAIRQGKRKW